MSIRLTAGQRELLAEKIADAGNLAVGALIFGQALADRRFSVAMALLGLAVWTAFLIAAAAMRGGRR